MERWEGCVAVVTGASAGIGAALCEDLVNQGMIVVGLARREDLLKSMKDQLQHRKGTFHFISTDIANDSEVRTAFKWIKDNLGGVDVLVNNAATNTRGLAWEHKIEDWHRIFSINVFGLVACAQEAVKSMMERNINGHIVNVTSVSGHKTPNLNSSIYACSKHAVRVFTESLRRDLISQNSKIKVTDIIPGLVETELFDKNNIAVDFVKYTHLKPKDIAEEIRNIIASPPNVQVNEMVIRAVGDDLGAVTALRK